MIALGTLEVRSPGAIDQIFLPTCSRTVNLAGLAAQITKILFKLDLLVWRQDA